MASNIPGGGSPSTPPPLPQDPMPTSEQSARFLSDSRDLMRGMLELIKGMPEHTVLEKDLKRRLAIEVCLVVDSLLSCVTSTGTVTANKQKISELAKEVGRVTSLVCTLLDTRDITRL